MGVYGEIHMLFFLLKDFKIYGISENKLDPKIFKTIKLFGELGCLYSKRGGTAEVTIL